MSGHAVEHNQGGSDSPYEKYHLTEEQMVAATRLAGPDDNGLLSPANVAAISYAAAPSGPDAPGTKGQRAVGGSTYYVHNGSEWRKNRLRAW